MTKRYVTLRRVRAADIDCDPDAENYLSRTVFEDDTPYSTGLYDAYGSELFSISDIDPIGFVRWDTFPKNKG